MYTTLMANQASVATTQAGPSNVLQDNTHAPEEDECDTSQGDEEHANTSIAFPLVPSPIAGVALWRRLLLLVYDWWGRLSLAFLCGVGHVTRSLALAS